jgi:signal peptide peptidase SppA
MRAQLEQDTMWAIRAELVPALRATMARFDLGAPDDLEAAAAGQGEPQAALRTAGANGGGGGLQAFREGFREALRNDDVDTILIDVDSPGGSTSLITETATEIREARGEKPIVAVANTQAASAAYWIASQADELIVTPSGYVGSIGTYLLHIDWSENNAQAGINPTYIFAGRHKVEGNPEEPLDEEARAEFQREVDEVNELFIQEVALGRGVPADTVRGETFGEGRMLSANRAVAAGMADGVDTFEATVARLAGSSTSTQPRRDNRAAGRYAALATARPGHIQL